MRFSCKIFITKGSKIPSDYRRYLLSLIKEAIKNGASDGQDFYERFYLSNQTKPFTFSAYFPLKNGELNGDFFTFFFSTNDYEFLMRIYNGLIYLSRSDRFKLFSDPKFAIGRFNMIPDKTFDKNQIIFKTISPFLVRDIENGDNYLVPKGSLSNKKFKYAKEKEISEIENSLKISIKSSLNKYMPGDTSGDLDLNIVKVELTPVIHASHNSDFKFTLPALKGLIKISANPDVLKFIYDIGIGARRSEGFGMLEVGE